MMICYYLLKMRALDRFVKWAEKSHGDFNAILIAGKEEIIIKHSCGSWKGDDLKATLPIISTQLVV